MKHQLQMFPGKKHQLQMFCIEERGVILVRAYIFTDAERRLLMDFIESKERNKQITLLISRINRYFPEILHDFRLLLRVKRLVRDGY